VVSGKVRPKLETEIRNALRFRVSIFEFRVSDFASWQLMTTPGFSPESEVV